MPTLLILMIAGVAAFFFFSAARAAAERAAEIGRDACLAAGVQWLGFAGSGLVFVAVGVLGAALVFRFSWAHVAERIGARIETFIESRREKREIAQDLALGQQAARERQETVQEERTEV